MLRPLRFGKATAAALAGLMALVPLGAAAFQFDQGIPFFWQCQGTCGTAAPNGVVGPSPFSNQSHAWVATRTSGVSGLAPDNIGGVGQPTTGSTLRTNTFWANQGTELGFYFNYVTTDGGGYADFAWVRLLNAANQEVAILFTARSTPGANTVPGFSMPPVTAVIDPPTVPIFRVQPIWSALGADSGRCWDIRACGFTGWVKSTFQVPRAGAYSLEFGVVNWWDPSIPTRPQNDAFFQSGMAIDGVTIDGKTLPTFPLPGTEQPPAGIPAIPLLGLIVGALLLGRAGVARLNGRKGRREAGEDV